MPGLEDRPSAAAPRLTAHGPPPSPLATGPDLDPGTDRAAARVIAMWTALLALVTLAAHAIPLYFVETDLLGEYIPAARELWRGAITGAHYTFKGPGYPALLALASAACGNDAFLAARLLSVAAAGLSAWFAYRLVARLSGTRTAALALGIVLVSPALVRYSIEAGTDTPALALMLGSTLLALGSGSWRRCGVAGFVAACAVLTRGNAWFLVAAALAGIAGRAAAAEPPCSPTGPASRFHSRAGRCYAREPVPRYTTATT